jgi:hypothetical protein
MTLGADEQSAILSKSLIGARKISIQLRQIDRDRFPTPSSESARELLLNAIDALIDPANVGPMDPAVLYNRLFAIQHLADSVHRSSTDRISWPLVSYCDQMWLTFFGTNGPRIFYSLTPEYNYRIHRFSNNLEDILTTLLPAQAINSLRPARELYCLQLASAEDDNLPLYANIGHEFGHALWDRDETKLVASLGRHALSIFREMHNTLNTLDSNQAQRRGQRLAYIIIGFAKELYCDMVGASLMGVAFLLSLFEIAWGRNKNTWKVALSPELLSLRAYPSFHYRLHLINKWVDLPSFNRDAQALFTKLDTLGLRGLHTILQSIPLDHSYDVVNVLPDSDSDGAALKDTLVAHLDELERGLELFLDEQYSELSSSLSIKAPPQRIPDIYQLLLRLENHILPNIVPDNTLLGQCAEFSDILNASALFRMHLLTGGISELDNLVADSTRVERLMAKALEVSFIQRQYRTWQGTMSGRP